MDLSEDSSSQGTTSTSDVPGSSPVAKETLSLPRPVSLGSATMTPLSDKSEGSYSGNRGTPAASVQTPIVPKPSLLRFPVRIGLTWKKGERLEAQDFSNTWYPSKIVEISEEEKAVLIHFEGWNQRYDEWVDMASDRLRPSTRHSERKDKGLFKRRRVHPHPIYRPGDEVLARWKDCKKYPAKISRLVEESTYEVVFYDGVTHLIQAMNIQPLPDEMKAMKAKEVPPQPKAKLSFKQIKVNLPVSVRKRQEQRQGRNRQIFTGKVLTSSKKSPPKLVGKAKLLPKVTLNRDRELDVFSVTSNKGTPAPIKKVGKEPVTITCEATLSTLSEAECLKLFGSTAVGGGDASVVRNKELPSKSLEAVSTGKIETSNAESRESIPGNQKPFLTVGKESKRGRKPSGSRVRKRAYTDTSAGAKRRKLTSVSTVGTELDPSKDVKTAKKAQLPILGSGERSKSLDIPGYSGAPPLQAPLAPQIFIPSKAFIVEEDHNPFKCPHEGCTKDFRKENLLQYHIKYYHAKQEVSSVSSPTTAPHSVSSSASTASASVTDTLSISTAATATAATPVMSGSAGKHKVDAVDSSAEQLSTVATSVTFTPNITCTPKRRRRKTDSICSTDSEMSASSKNKSSSKRQRNDSEISVTTESPEIVGKESQTDSSRLVQELAAEEEILAWPDTEEADEEEMASDMVNCVCEQRHHTGLMIQCEVCLCWQHFKCADVNKTGVPPANYVCLICEKSPGMRDSCRYLHDMGWERRGELPTFPFVQQQMSDSNASKKSSTARLTTLASECNDLLTSLQGIKGALHSTRRQIKISEEEEDPEFQLWQTDWDNWIKPQEDLTPKLEAGDPDPSLTPSTLLFPGNSSAHYPREPVERDKEDKDSDRRLAAAVAESSPVSNSVFSTLMTPHSSTVSTLSTPPSTSNPMKTFSSQQPFSLSCTPPKTSATAATGEVTTLIEESKNSPVPTSDAMSSTATTGNDTDLCLSINTTQALSINTSVPSAPSPSSSSLSSLQMSTPPMMLSPAAGSAEPPPQTPSVGRANSVLLSIMKQADTDSLVKDLFPGPAGDASSLDPDKALKYSLATYGSLSTVKDLEAAGEKLSPPGERLSLTEKCFGPSMNALPKTEDTFSRASNQQGGLLGPSDEDGARETLHKASENCKGSNPAGGGPCPHPCMSAKTEGSGHGETHTPPSEQARKTYEQGKESGQRSQRAEASSLSASSQSDHLWGTEAKQNGKFSPEHLSSLYAGVNGMAERGTGFSNEDDEDTQDNDTDTAEESADPYKNCEENLLVHVQQVHTDIEQQLDELEARMVEMENSEHNNSTVQFSEDNILNDVPALKKSLSKLARYLMKVQHFAS